MALLDKLKEIGWLLTEEGLQKVIDNKSADSFTAKDVTDKALNIDLREIGGSKLPKTETKQGRSQSFEGNLVVQVMKVRNIAAPKANEESKTAPRLLLLEFTDGQTTSYGLEIENISAISMNTAPGTKILLTKGPIPIYQNHMMLGSQNIKVLGGYVSALAEKWELTRTMAKFAKSGRVHSGGQGPPPWIPFGQKIQQGDVSGDKSFKSLASDKKSLEIKKDNDDFNAQRSEAIAEAAKSAKSKTFGCGGKQMLDHNVKKIMDRGYSEENAKFALKLTRNNLERAMQNLKRRDERSQNPDASADLPVRNGRERRGRSQLEDEVKPSGPVSLFDFLETKLPQTAAPPPMTASAPPFTTKPTGGQNYNPFSGQSHPNSARTHPTHSGTSSKENYSSDYKSKSASSSNFDRSKFQNNMSASFAKRDSKPNSRREHSEGFNTLHSSSKSRSSNFDQSQSRPRYDNPFANNRPSNVNGGKAPRSSNPSYNAPNAPPPDFSQSKSVRSDDRRNSSRQPTNTTGKYPQRPNENTNNKLDALISSTASLSISHANNNGNKQIPLSVPPQHQQRQQQPHQRPSQQPPQRQPPQHPQQPPQHTQQPPPQPQHQPYQSQKPQQKPHQPQQHAQSSKPAVNDKSQPANMPYNPYKIMGFQNKETNEYAMNLIKGQMFIQQPAIPIPMTHTHVPAYHSFVAGYTMEQPPPPHPPQQQQQQNATIRNWMIGEECLAKYWEDGQYYKATITNVSKKTCVVNFPEYGNYEEVLTSDCLPLPDVNNMVMSAPPPSHGDPQQGMRTVLAPQMAGNPQTYPNRHFNAAPKYRFERKVYVPPAQRDK